MARPRTRNLDVETAGTVIVHRPTQDMIEDAWRRNAAPRPVTAWLMGDPPPGQSALDRQQGQRACSNFSSSSA